MIQLGRGLISGAPSMKRLVMVAAMILVLGAGDLAARQEPLESSITRAKLQKRISVEFKEAPLSDVVEFLRSVLDVNIILDRDSIYGRQVEDIPVTLKLRHVRAETLLRFLTRKADIKYTIIDGVVFISADVVEPVYLRIYDVRDLIFTVPDFGELAGTTSGQTTQDSSSGTGR